MFAEVHGTAQRIMRLVANYDLDGTCEATAVDALVHAYTRNIPPPICPSSFLSLSQPRALCARLSRSSGTPSLSFTILVPRFRRPHVFYPFLLPSLSTRFSTSIGRLRRSAASRMLASSFVTSVFAGIVSLRFIPLYFVQPSRSCGDVRVTGKQRQEREHRWKRDQTFSLCLPGRWSSIDRSIKILCCARFEFVGAMLARANRLWFRIVSAAIQIWGIGGSFRGSKQVCIIGENLNESMYQMVYRVFANWTRNNWIPRTLRFCFFFFRNLYRTTNIILIRNQLWRFQPRWINFQCKTNWFEFRTRVVYLAIYNIFFFTDCRGPGESSQIVRKINANLVCVLST